METDRADSSLNSGTGGRVEWSVETDRADSSLNSGTGGRVENMVSGDGQGRFQFKLRHWGSSRKHGQWRRTGQIPV